MFTKVYVGKSQEKEVDWGGGKKKKAEIWKYWKRKRDYLMIFLAPRKELLAA